MNSLRVPLIILAVAQAVLAAWGLGISLFADGGVWWERIPLVLLHPLAVIALLGLLLSGRPTPRLAGIALTLLLLSIIGSVALSGTMAVGLTNGDWWLPLAWAVIPLLSLPYAIHHLGGRRANAPRLAA